MSHPTEEDLVLRHYGEHDGHEELDAHLDACASCRDAYDALVADLAAADSVPVPERGEDYGAQVWARLEPRLTPLRSRPRAWPAYLALAASLALAFVLGRSSAERALPAPPPPAPGVVRERVLLVALGDHLDRSQMVLMEIANASPTTGLDITAERHLASELVDSNRLYRQSATRAGEASVADVLDEVERVLVEVAHSKDRLSGPELVELQRRIESRGLVFKIRVVGTRVRERQKQTTGVPPAVLS